MDWSRIARETIAAVHRDLPATATLSERKAALFAAYPFGPREMWPYKAWCKAQRQYLARFAPQPTTADLLAKHLPPLERMMLKAEPASLSQQGREQAA